MTSTRSNIGLKDPINKSSERARNKGGAPQKKIKRASGIRVRLNAKERFLIESKARMAGMRISDWVRAAALKAKVVARITDEDRRILHLLAGMANNLNQLTKLAHTNGIMSIVIKCDQLLTEIDQTLRYLNSDDGENT
ncbi:plasmid mobilization relaxosome protein MobC [Pedobacter sp. PAMC26386]|nr:plasmid mobilization relaxosome protein MobC [Pedobacter sp. PAMC26386]